MLHHKPETVLVRLSDVAQCPLAMNEDQKLQLKMM